MVQGKLGRLARRTAARAARAIRRHRQSPTPENYHVWYAYFSGGHPELTAELDALLAEDRPLDDGRMLRLYERHLSPAAEAKQLREAGERLERLTAKLGRELADAGAGTRRYRDRLDALAGEVEGAATLAQLKRSFETLLAETSAVIETMAAIETRLCESNAEIARLRHDLEQARSEALTDPLTGIGNRRRLETAFREAVEGAERGGPVPSLILLDIDHFKAFNDHHGHRVGDRVLQVVARLMAANVKEGDVVGRLGGEEFAVLLRDALESQAVEVAERLRRRIANCRIRLKNANEFLDRLTVSLGVGRLRPGETVQGWLERVDAALYAAKRQGRDRVVLAEEPEPEPVAVNAGAGAAAPAAARRWHPAPAMEGS